MTDETNAGVTDAPVETKTDDKTVNLETLGTEQKAPENEKPAEAEKPADKPADTDGGEPEDEGEKKRLSGSERQKRKAARLAAELAETRRALAEMQERQSAASKPDAKPGIDREPREDDYKDYFEYRDAKIAWDLKQTLRSEREAEVRRRAEQQRAEILQERIDAYEDQAEVVRERIPDFDKVVSAAANIQVKPEVSEEILASDKSALIQYHLATRPDKVRELNALSGRELAKEIGRLEARLHLPQPKKATEAPPPLKIPASGAAPSFDPFTTDDMDAYRKYRMSGGGGKAPF